MTLQDEIRAFMPRCEQEALDRAQMLRFMADHEDYLERGNLVAHMTTSIWTVNRARTKTLMVYHNIYDSWSWVGGHADGCPDLRSVALRELREETGVTSGRLVGDEILSLETLTVDGHIRRGTYVPSHLHFLGRYCASVTDVHLQGVGWTGASSALEFGTTGQSKRLEALRISVPNQPLAGGISYEVHAQGIGRMPAAANGELAGTEGESRRLEAVRVKLTGDLAAENGFSVWYRVHSQTYGWLGWAHDGEDAGTTGLSKRAEAIDVQVLPQGQVPAGYDASQAACVSK